MKPTASSLLLVIFLGWLLAACSVSTPAAGTPTPATSSTASASQARISPTSFPTPTQTARPGWVATILHATERPTSTRQAEPPTPTLTPTFDVHHVWTSTPAPAAVCSQNLVKPEPTLSYNGKFNMGVEAGVFLDYLNHFGAGAFRQADQQTRDDDGRLNNRIILYKDLTNDGVPEVVVSYGPFYIFGCQDGAYRTLLETEWSARGIRQKIEAINDLNQNGIPEILVLEDIGTQADSWYELFEWGDGKFNSLFNWSNSFPRGETKYLEVLAGGTFSFQDVDHDGMREIVLHKGTTLLADYNGSAPWRRMTEYFKWDGSHFTLTKKFFDPPQYRFQAAEDADHAMLAQEYNRALDLYQQVIFNDKLEWWTNERKDYLFWFLPYQVQPPPPNLTPPAPDPNEYLYLSAYARFRIMVLHLIRGYDSDAQVVYQTLLKKYPEGKPGSIYARMAQAFWDNYAANHAVGLACQAAREIADGSQSEAPTRYLLDDYVRGGFKVNYTTQQLCPLQ